MKPSAPHPAILKSNFGNSVRFCACARSCADICSARRRGTRRRTRRRGQAWSNQSAAGGRRFRARRSPVRQSSCSRRGRALTVQLWSIPRGLCAILGRRSASSFLPASAAIYEFPYLSNLCPPVLFRRWVTRPPGSQAATCFRDGDTAAGLCRPTTRYGPQAGYSPLQPTTSLEYSPVPDVYPPQGNLPADDFGVQAGVGGQLPQQILIYLKDGSVFAVCQLHGRGREAALRNDLRRAKATSISTGSICKRPLRKTRRAA